MSLRIFDTDALTEILAGNDAFLARLVDVPIAQRATTVVTVEEMLAGRLADIRRAESRGRPGLVLAYQRLCATFTDLRRLPVLPYSTDAHARYQSLRPSVKGKVGVHDLRIAAIAVSVGGTVVTRNRHHLGRVPGLAVEFWP